MKLKEFLQLKETEQKELELDEKNLNVQAKKLHQEFTKPKFNGYFYRKPATWNEALSHSKNNKGAISLEDLFGILSPEVIQDLEFTESEVYGGSFNKPLKSFSPKFKAKGLDAFFVITSEGIFAIRTEGADYARYVATVEESEEDMEYE